MSRLLRRLKLAWKFARDIPFVEMPNWDERDARVFYEFMATGTGEKLALTLRSLTVQECMRSVDAGGRDDHQYRAGVANGFRLLATTIDQFADLPVKEELNEVRLEDGPTADLRWMREYVRN